MTDAERKAILEQAEYAYDKEAEWLQNPPCNPRALEAALSAVGFFSPAQVRVKALEWEDQGKGDPGAWGAGDPLNPDDWLYYARPVESDPPGQTLLEITVAPGEHPDDDDGSDYWLHRPQVGDCYGSIEALKAQCQADFERRARRILSTLEPAPDGWQPIETAPKAKNVLLFAVTDVAADGRILNWKMETGYWSQGYDDDCGLSPWHWDGRQLKSYEIQPTHWRPLPAPPSTEREGK